MEQLLSLTIITLVFREKLLLHTAPACNLVLRFYFQELLDLAAEADLMSKIEFLKSPTDQVKVDLFRSTDCLVYTPSGEHFGIVPLEAMYNELPVIAVNDGGPTETVINGQTGFLKSPTPEEFADAMRQVVQGGSSLKEHLGKNGRKRVLQSFSFKAFSEKLDNYVQDVLNK